MGTVSLAPERILAAIALKNEFVTHLIKWAGPRLWAGKILLLQIWIAFFIKRTFVKGDFTPKMKSPR